MIQSKAVTRIFLVLLFILTIPFSAQAGLMRVMFDIQKDDFSAPASGSGFLQFEDDINYGQWIGIDSLTNLESKMGVSWLDQYNQRLHAVFSTPALPPIWYGSLMVKEIAPNTFSASFDSPRADGVIMKFWTFFPDGSYGGCSLYDSGAIELHDSGGHFRPSSMLNSTYTTSVWFDDPQPVPAPSSALLLLSALLPVLGRQRKRKEPRKPLETA